MKRYDSIFRQDLFADRLMVVTGGGSGIGRCIAHELASLGAKVLQTRSVEFANKYKVPLRVLSSFEPGEGTLISYDDEATSMEAPLISGIAFATGA